jgi:hypothetical protein
LKDPTVRESPQHMVVAGHGTTILPPTPRPPDRLGSCSRRHGNGYIDSLNLSYFHRQIDSNNDANDDGFIFWSNVASNAWCSDG